MSRVWFSHDLETVATWWRVLRRDGVTLGFVTHDRDIWFDGVLHRAASGIVPSAIRRSANFEPDSAEVEGVLSHDSIASDDLTAGRFDGARVLIGIVDWESSETQVLYRGAIGTVSEESGKFTADLQSRKAELLRDPIPRTSPNCRASFCGEGCGLSSVRYTHEGVLTDSEPDSNSITVSNSAIGQNLVGGTLRWLDGPHAGSVMNILSAEGPVLLLDELVDGAVRAVARRHPPLHRKSFATTMSIATISPVFSEPAGRLPQASHNRSNCLFRWTHKLRGG